MDRIPGAGSPGKKLMKDDSMKNISLHARLRSANLPMEIRRGSSTISWQLML
jgi:hypothetical protein